MRYFITLSYDGTRYHGWQIQPEGVTVQQLLQDALATLLRQHVIVVGAGRTDAGVHARQMVAHIDVDGEINDVDQLTYKLNRFLPYDISIQNVRLVSDDMHARFSAVRRRYRYFIHTEKDPFKKKYSCELHYELDYELMNVAAAQLKTYSDFGAFCKSHSDVKTTVCTVTKAHWVEYEPNAWYFEIEANRFLRNMVRAVVGTLIEIGRHRMSLSQFDQVVREGRRTGAGESMPANALFLECVEY